MPIANSESNQTENTWITNVVTTTYGVGQRIDVADGEAVTFAMNDKETSFVRYLADYTTAPTFSGLGTILDEDGNALTPLPTKAGIYTLVKDGSNTRLYPQCCEDNTVSTPLVQATI